jgi:hypothetical protein
VRALRAERDAEQHRTDARSDREQMSRRRVLRGAGVALAGAAGALASPALTRDAAAATGGNTILGGNNVANQPTEIAKETTGPNAEDGPTLVVENAFNGAPLRLAPTDPESAFLDGLGPGDLLNDADLFLSWAFDGGSPGVVDVGTVYDSKWASQYFPRLPPHRLLDTRQAGATATNWGRTRVTNPSGKFDGSGRLIGGRTIDLRLNDFSDLAIAAAGNFTVTGSSVGGYISAWNTGDARPAASLLNFAGRQTLANWAIVPIGGDALNRDSISIFALQTTHVIFDFSGFFAGGVENFGPQSPLQVAPLAAARPRAQPPRANRRRPR